MTVRVNSDMISTPVRTGRARPTAGAVSNAAVGAVETFGRFRSVVAAIALAVLGALATALLPTPAAAEPLPTVTVIYGVAEDNNIYSIDPATGAVTGTTSTATLGLSGSLANAFALDREKAQVYFMGNTSTSSNTLFFWDIPSNTLGELATATQLGVTNMPRNASFYADRFWFIESGDNLLRSASISYTAGLPSSISLDSPLSITGVTDGKFLNPNDIAINPLTQTLYGSDTIVANGGTGDFFSINLASLTGPVSYTKVYDQPVLPGGQVGVQLAFDQTYGTLYGQDYASGVWYTVDTSPGGSFAPTGGTSATEFRMRDLAGGVQAVPEPSSIVLAGFGVVAGGLVLRRRHRRRCGAARVDGGGGPTGPSACEGLLDG